MNAHASSSSVVRTRFAPSPSGHLHVGGARTALFCWAYAKGRASGDGGKGKFILRIEDTDQKRSSDAASMAFLEDLKWLGIEWDEGPEYEGCGGGEFGPYHQSQRLATYDRYVEQLIASEHAYRAFETPEELDAARAKAAAEKRNYRYDRGGLKLSQDQIQAYLREGRPYVVRFKVPEGRQIVVRDQVRGDVTTDSAEIDDFVIRKADGFPMYNFAVVVDDELMGVTHVIRAQEHLSNTPRHILLQEGLGFRTPTYAHVSIITNPDGSKMSKRDKDKTLRAAVTQQGLEGAPDGVIDPERWRWWRSDKDHQLDLDAAERLAQVLNVSLPEINVDDFRRNGYLPEVMINYLALLGWNPGGDVEVFDRAFLLERFDFDRIIKSPAAFDRNKLLAFNADAILKMPPEEFERRLREHCERYHPEFTTQFGPEQFSLFARTNQTRSKTLESQLGPSRFFLAADDAIEYEQGKTVTEALAKGSPCGYDHLAALIPVLEAVGSWTVIEIEAAVKVYADAHAAGKLGKVAQPLRIAVSGGTVSPAIFDTLVILGKRSTLNRIQRCLSLQPAAS